MKTTVVLILMALFALAGPAMAQTVNVDYDSEYDPSGNKTFAWVESARTSLADISDEKQSSGSAYILVRASIFHSFGLLDEAIAETRKAVDEDGSNRMLHSILASLYEEAGRTEEALAEYKKLAE